MKKIYLYFITIALCPTIVGCKSSQHAEKGNDISVSIEDFKHLNNRDCYKEYKALLLNELVNVSEVDLIGFPWNPKIIDYYSFDSGWRTEIKDKILFLKDSVNGERFSDIDYINPLGLRWDLMEKCKMWLYSQDKKGNIHKRKIKKKEIIRERLNDSICRVRLKIQEDIAGKILVRRYKLLSPYLAGPYSGVIRVGMPGEIKPWIFQKEVPLLHGVFKIYLRYGKNEVIKIGNGQMNIEQEKTTQSLSVFYRRGSDLSYLEKAPYEKRESNIIQINADLFTVTVSNVMPLPKGSDAQPLGITISRSEQKKDK